MECWKCFARQTNDTKMESSSAGGRSAADSPVVGARLCVRHEEHGAIMCNSLGFQCSDKGVKSPNRVENKEA